MVYCHAKVAITTEEESWISWVSWTKSIIGWQYDTFAAVSLKFCGCCRVFIAPLLSHLQDAFRHLRFSPFTTGFTLGGKRIWATVWCSWSRHLNDLHAAVERVPTSGWESARDRSVVLSVGRRRSTGPVPCGRRHVATRRRSEDLHRARQLRQRHPAAHTARLTLRRRLRRRVENVFEAARFAGNVVGPAWVGTAHRGSRVSAQHRSRRYWSDDRRECDAAWTNQWSTRSGPQSDPGCSMRGFGIGDWTLPTIVVKEALRAYTMPLYGRRRVDACITRSETQLVDSGHRQLGERSRLQLTQTCITRFLGRSACRRRLFRHRTRLCEVELSQRGRRRVKREDSRRTVRRGAKSSCGRRCGAQQVNSTGSFDMVWPWTGVLRRFRFRTTAAEEVLVFQQLTEKVEVWRNCRALLFYVPATLQTPATNHKAGFVNQNLCSSQPRVALWCNVWCDSQSVLGCVITLCKLMAPTVPPSLVPLLPVM